MVNVERLIYGIYPKSEKLRIRIGRWERGSVSTVELRDSLVSETNELINMLRNNGIDHYTGPLFNWFDIFRPFLTVAKGLQTGPLTRYLETNTFYRIPDIHGKISLSNSIELDIESVDGLPLPMYLGESNTVFLPGLKSLYEMSVKNGKRESDFYSELSEVYSSILKVFPGKKVFIFEVVDPGEFSYSLYEDITEPQNIILNLVTPVSGDNLSSISGKMYSVIAGSKEADTHIPDHHSIMKGRKLIGAHTTRIESLREMENKIADIDGGILVTTDDYLDFLPRKIADQKVQLMGGFGR